MKHRPILRNKLTIRIKIYEISFVSKVLVTLIQDGHLA
jgi:hypothetical protein